jgi:hypothetical protein
MPRYLVVAHQTAESDELLARLIEIAGEDPTAEFVLLIPATPVGDLLVWEEGRSDEAAARRAEAARRFLAAAGLRVADARIGDADPSAAIADELRADPTYSAIVISTLPVGVSRWLRADLPARVRRTAPEKEVIHVVSSVRSQVAG